MICHRYLFKPLDKCSEFRHPRVQKALEDLSLVLLIKPPFRKAHTCGMTAEMSRSSGDGRLIFSERWTSHLLIRTCSITEEGLDFGFRKDCLLPEEEGR